MLQDDLSSLELHQSQPVIYDRPIGLRLLYQDAESGAEHYLLRYPPDLRAQRHRHTAAHTIILHTIILFEESWRPTDRSCSPAPMAISRLARSTIMLPPTVALACS